MNRQDEVDKVRDNHDLAKSSAVALQLEEQAIRDLQTVVDGFKPGHTLTVQSHAALTTAVQNLSVLNTDLQSAVPFVPQPGTPKMNPPIVQPNTRLDQTHNQPTLAKHP